MKTHPTKFSTIAQITKIFSLAGILALLVIFIVWLWQRQPEPPSQQKSQDILSSTSSANENRESETTIAIASPKNETVLNATSTALSGKTQPNSFIVVYSNTIAQVIKTDKVGNFKLDLNLDDGLNLISLATISDNYKELHKKGLTLLVFPNTPYGNSFFAGTVKSIFDTLVTVSLEVGQRNIRTSKTTEFDIPEDEENPKAQDLQNLRVGDYVIAMGDATDEDTMIAGYLEAIRENKPQNNEQFIVGKILTDHKLNLFSVKDSKTGKPVEFSLNKVTQIIANDEESDQKAIIKDKTLIIIYHTVDDKNIPDLIYILP